jgi:signal transduction protein with GAF and PtsI domain
MKATWTTESGKKIELETAVIGKTAKDHIYTQYTLLADGKEMKVAGTKTVSGIRCLEISITFSNKQLLKLPAHVAAEIDAEIDAVKAAIGPVEITITEYEKQYEELNREMNKRNSDY